MGFGATRVEGLEAPGCRISASGVIACLEQLEFRALSLPISVNVGALIIRTGFGAHYTKIRNPQMLVVII